MIPSIERTTRRKAVWGPKRTLAAVAVLVLGLASNALAAGSHDRGATRGRAGRPNAEARDHRKLDKELTYRADHHSALAKSKVIVTLKSGAQLPTEFKKYANSYKRLGIINGQALSLPNGLIKRLSQHPDVFDIRYDRPLAQANYTTALTTGGLAVNRALGLTGAGVGIAIIDSGIAPWHDDLTNRTSTLYPYGNQRVKAFVDFVNGQIAPYDDEGHGTHVAGIIAGNGYDTNSRQAGVAPDADLISLKVRYAKSQGSISNIIQALDVVLANTTQYNIREHPVGRLDDVADRALAVRVQHFQRDEIRVRRHTRLTAVRIVAVARDDAGDVRAMTLIVVRRDLAVHEVDERLHPLIAVRIQRRGAVRQIVVPRRDPRVDDRDADAGAREAERAVHGESTRRQRRRVVRLRERTVVADVENVRMLRQPLDQPVGQAERLTVDDPEPLVGVRVLLELGRKLRTRFQRDDDLALRQCRVVVGTISQFLIELAMVSSLGVRTTGAAPGRTSVVRARGQGVGGQAEHEHRHGGQRALWSPDRLASGRPFNRWDHGAQLNSKSPATWAIRLYAQYNLL